MFDGYSQLRNDLRTVAFFHPQTLPTWPEMIRQNHDLEIKIRSYKTYSENPLFLLEIGLMPRFLRWQSNLRQPPVRWIRNPKSQSPFKRHSPVHR